HGLRFKSPLGLGQEQFDGRANRKRVNGVHIAAARAEVRDATLDPCLRFQFDDLCLGCKRKAEVVAALGRGVVNRNRSRIWVSSFGRMRSEEHTSELQSR